MIMTKEQIAELVKTYGGDEKNTGKTHVQIAIYTKRIAEITEHLQKNKKDHAARRGLIQLVGKRRNMLDYLHKKDVEQYRQILKDLGIRK
ncbi:MAG TPA: 30S ribosomal protein S15 [Bacteroidetes bacterium]|nr:30S ribosomal protein S15 [Bacteroidota bacterium]